MSKAEGSSANSTQLDKPYLRYLGGLSDCLELADNHLAFDAI